MSFRFPQPSNEADFELFCLRFLREFWRCQTLQRYGKRGERQHGIDLIDEAGGTPLRAVQCKHHEPDKTVPPAEIEAEVTKALGSGLQIDEYYIFTTARKTIHSQKAIIQINRDHGAIGKLKVFLWPWADVEERLSEMDDATQERVLRGDSGRSGPAVCQLIANVMTDHFDRPIYSTASALDTELEAIQAALERYETEVAEKKLDEFEARTSDKFEPHHWYQLKVLRFRLQAGRWRWKDAGRILIDAKRHMPDSDRAKINEVYGYELLGDKEKAHALASGLRAELGQSVRLLSTWIRTAPESMTFAELAGIAEPFVNDDEEINLALAHRAFLEEIPAEAIPFARRATEIDANSPQAWFVFGQAKHAIGFKNTAGSQVLHLREAEQHYDRAAGLAHAQKMPGLEAAIRFNRGKVRYVLGDKRAEADYAAAVELANPDQGLRAEYAGFLLQSERPEDALRELAAEPGEMTADSQFYAAAARYERNIGDDRKNAWDSLLKLITSEPSGRWVDAHILIAQWAIENKTLSQAQIAIKATKIHEYNPLIFHTLLGWLAASGGDAESAKSEYQEALNARTDVISRDHLFLLAQALVAVHEDELAVPILEQCYRRGVFDIECRKLLDVARRLNRHDVSSKVCRELRLAGETDPRIVHTEISVLQLYDPHEALSVAEQYLNLHPGDRQVTLWQSFLALRLDRSELIVSDISRLPEPTDLTPEGCGLVIHILDETKQHSAALRYSYEALRAHFEKEFAHGQYLARFLALSGHCPELQDNDKAGPGLAVCYNEEHDSSDRWLIIEDGDAPELTRDEYAPDHPISQSLVGRKVGEEVVACDSGIQSRTLTIREVIPKYVYRYHDCRDLYQLRFPGGTAIQLITVGSGDEFDPSPIIKSLELRKKSIEQLNDQYRARRLPFSTYVELSGRDEIEVWGYLVSNPDLGIYCSRGDVNELQAGLSLARECKSVVLDLTALLTMAQLGQLELLNSATRTFEIGQTTFDRLQHFVDSAEDAKRAAGSVVLSNDGQLGRIDVSVEERNQHSEFLKQLRDSVRDTCQICPCPQAAALEPKRRDQIVRAIGRASLDAILLASMPERALWTDDTIIALIGQTDFQMRRLWTQPILIVLQEEGILAPPEFDQTVAKLVGWNYQGIHLTEHTFIAAADIADWRMDHWPVPQAMETLGNTNVPQNQRLRVAAQAIRLVWQKGVPYHSRQGFVFAILAGLRSERLIRRLHQLVTLVFPLDVVSAGEIQDYIAIWLRQPTTVILP